MRAGSPTRRRREDGVPKPDFEHHPRAGSPLKALTVWQPWASLIVLGAKPYEFRGWRFPQSMLDKRIVIHAAARRMKPAEVWEILRSLRKGGEEAATTCLHRDKALEILEPLLKSNEHDPLPLGCGLGTAVLGEPRNGFEIAEEFGLPSVNDSDRDEHANWGWPMLDVERWDETVPMKGLQGFWGWPTPDDHGL
jgi:hypothetical protein